MEDRLQHLDEMKKKLKQLRERRPLLASSFSPATSLGTGESKKIDNGFVSHLLKGIDKIPKNQSHQGTGLEHGSSISVSVQTDEMIEHEVSEVLVDNEVQKIDVITYEKAVQTDMIDTDDEGDQKLKSEVSMIEESAESVGHSIGEVTSSIGSEYEELGTKLKPLIVTSQNISLETTTFALLEVLENKENLTNRNQLQENEYFAYSHEFNLEFVQDTSPICVSVDYHQGFILVLTQLESNIRQYNTLTVCNVINFETGEIVDTVQFQGQTLIKGEFIVVKDSKILTMLLTSYNGKTILYELRAVAAKAGGKTKSIPKIERNVISRNYHNWPIYAVWQHHVRESKVLTASTDGTIRELNLIDLKPVLDPTSWNGVKVVPFSRSELILKEQYGNSKYLSQLTKLSMYDEVTIKAICTFHNDPSSIYAGCEDGGIYKIVIEKGEGKRNIKLSLDNNGFIPVAQSETDSNYSPKERDENGDKEDDIALNQEPLFHLGSVTALFPCSNFSGLMLSCGMDWKCILWDVPNNQRIFTIELDSPVICCDIFTLPHDKGQSYLALLTALEFHIYEINLSSTHTHLGNTLWSLNIAPKRIFSISATKTRHQLSMFTHFKLVHQQEQCYVILGGDGPTLECYRIIS
ncbi:dynein intermediate chain Ecym_3583 [Eremothecium cymbalariae DBVPG|uniref:Uncharacterized protein n=1 Tax=Eremothecium cymbalariae (strain CBS 270.75 / DBVPG 7215 / KCTC 17166 / NRRL Y-17582) TaxID=931890 RepID=G8JQR6_ERECY|nr:Hypothetical protein Ecym_3583 [Eremothecium cymbalariae DBVPG\